MKVINASKGKCGNHKLKCPHVMLQHMSVQEVSMSVKDKKRASHQGLQCTKCTIDCITPDMLNNSRWGILQVLIEFVMTGIDSD